MPCPIERTRQRLLEALDRDLAFYTQYVSNKEILTEYLQSTKRAVLQAVKYAFDEKIRTL